MFGSLVTAHAQEPIQVSGTVSDEANAPLVGVSVSIKDRVSGGVMTNSKGQYTIKVEPYSTLIFSYVGFGNQEIKLGTKSLLNVRLSRSDSSALTQVIVTAAGPQKKAVCRRSHLLDQCRTTSAHPLPTSPMDWPVMCPA